MIWYITNKIGLRSALTSQNRMRNLRGCTHRFTLDGLLLGSLKNRAIPCDLEGRRAVAGLDRQIHFICMHSAPGPGRFSPTQWFLVRNTAAAEPPHFSGSPLIKHYSLAPLDFKATSGINLSGTVTNMQGQGISGAIVSCQAPNLDGLYLSITTSSTGSYAIVAPLNRPVDLSLRMTLVRPLGRRSVLITTTPAFPAAPAVFPLPAPVFASCAFPGAFGKAFRAPRAAFF